ncbi:Zn(II)2Cys6 transcription factor [Aspergillus undulatus]|uniref:Zn(II)2Cys6 transcription factor n=1 Tax=Aspergillus undulatus TaxID=1810928 RepID=UPI003CCD2B7A
MPNSPRSGNGKPTRDNKPDRVHRACDRCNNSRTRCSGETPWCPELNYACQYERTVKKRGPKRKSAQPCHLNRSSIPTPPVSRTYYTPDWTSADSACHEEKIQLCPTPFWQVKETDSQSSASASDLDCSFEATLTGFYMSGHNHFPLDLNVLSNVAGSENDGQACRYPCLSPVLPLLKGTMGPEDACDLLDIYFADSETAGPSTHCPYVLSPVIREKSLLRHANPRPMSSALVTIILWCVAHTADLEALQCPIARARVTQRLYFLSMKLLRARDGDQWHLASESEMPLYTTAVDETPFPTTSDSQKQQSVDDVLSYVLLACVVSGTEFKEECLKWWNKAVLLVKRLGFNSEGRIAAQTPSSQQMSLAAREDHEERRRAFWLVYALDRHFALLFNEPLHIHDFECGVLYPLPEWIWRDLDNVSLEDIPPRLCGPPTQLDSRNKHPRLGGVDEAYLASTVEGMLARCENSLEILRTVRTAMTSINSCHNPMILPTSPTLLGDPADGLSSVCNEEQRTAVVIAYSQYIIRVLHSLLCRHIDYVSIVENSSNCVLPSDLTSVTASTLATGDAMVNILGLDKGLAFMPFAFGVYLFHGSINFFSLTDRMTQAGAADMAGRGYEAIVRANEIASGALGTSYQRKFTRIVRQRACNVGGMIESRGLNRYTSVVGRGTS